MIKINIIDLALDLKDFKWAKELSKKLTSTKENENDLHNNKIKYIADMDMKNNTPVYLENNLAKIPLSDKELENDLVMAKSKNNNDSIKKDEIIDIEYLSSEEQYSYKLFYMGWIQGRSNAVELYENNKKLRKIIDEYTELVNMYEKQVNDLNNYIKILKGEKKWWQFWR